jgi:hypothetical protein
MLTNRRPLAAFVLFGAGVLTGNLLHPLPRAEAQGASRVFELRTYTAPEGKLDALNARFRDHTTRLFAKHGMTNIGYWVPSDAPKSQDTLVYILAYPSREAAKASWAAFQKDPEWQKARTESEANGRLTTKVESVFMEPTGYSPLK